VIRLIDEFISTTNNSASRPVVRGV
jgi:hypothetical protein